MAGRACTGFEGKLVPQAVAKAAGVPEQPHDHSPTRLVETLRAKEMLLFWTTASTS